MQIQVAHRAGWYLPWGEGMNIAAQVATPSFHILKACSLPFFKKKIPGQMWVWHLRSWPLEAEGAVLLYRGIY